MSKHVTRSPIPWSHKSSDVVASWNWATPHFSATIIAEGLSTKKMYNWKILDKSKGFPRPFDNGMSMSFTESVDTIVEIIAKSYPRELGYQEFAGDLATTFQINDGNKYNFASAIGEAVVLKALDSSGEEGIYTGLFDVHNYDFIITTGENALIIPPLKVIDILREFGMTSFIKSNIEGPVRSKTNRIIHEEWRRGCTGKPGFRPGTVQHGPTTPYCAIHGI